MFGAGDRDRHRGADGNANAGAVEGRVRSADAEALVWPSSIRSRGIVATEPFVSNGMWFTSMSDPDGYRVEFESDTNVPEGTRLSEWEG